jgi:hypothetical protein
MSSPQSGGNVKPGSEQAPRQPSEWVVVFGVAYPATVILIEFVRHDFDAMPTYWYALAGLVPASNLVVWINLRDGASIGVKSLAFANGVAIAIAGFLAIVAYFYTFYYLVPILIWNAIVGIIFGLGILPIPPIAAFLCTLRLRLALCEGDTDGTSFRSLLRGFAAGSAMLLTLYVAPSAASRLGIPWAANSADVATTSTNVGRR